MRYQEKKKKIVKKGNCSRGIAAETLHNIGVIFWFVNELRDSEFRRGVLCHEMCQVNPGTRKGRRSRKVAWIGSDGAGAAGMRRFLEAFGEGL